MTVISESETQRRDRQRSMSVADFCAAYGIGRSKFHTEKKSGRLKIRKMGSRILITHEDAEAWLESLPRL